MAKKDRLEPTQGLETGQGKSRKGRHSSAIPSHSLDVPEEAFDKALPGTLESQLIHRKRIKEPLCLPGRGSVQSSWASFF